MNMCRGYGVMPGWSALVLASWLAGCATTGEMPLTTGADDQQAAPRAEKSPPADYPVAPFEGDALYQLLVAEIAGHRAHYDLALERYMAVAEETRDPGVAAHAGRIALYMKRNQTALRAVTIWAEEEPDNIDAHRQAVDLLLQAGRLEDALMHMERVKNLGGPAHFGIFAHQTVRLDAGQLKSLLTVVTGMLERHPDNEQLMFSKAVLLDRNGQPEAALALVESLLKVSRGMNVVQLKTNLLNTLNRLDEARRFLEKKAEELPENWQLQRLLGRLMVEQGDLEAAHEQFRHILRQFPKDEELLFSLALIALDRGEDVEAKGYLEPLIRWNQHVDQAHYYLGGIAERQGDKPGALMAYRRVGDGGRFLPAQARIAALLVADGRLDEARKHLQKVRLRHADQQEPLVMIEAQLLLDNGMGEAALSFLDGVLAAEPENINLLYFRAMAGQRFDRLDILEQDLRTIIELDPMHVDALNALGYTLTDRTDRHAEALELIEKALVLRPDEAAIIDSMGWVQYRLNNHEQALVHLRRALELFQNDEVAAHLGEVLWVIGERGEANQVWNRALELAPESDILKQVIKRFREE